MERPIVFFEPEILGSYQVRIHTWILRTEYGELSRWRMAELYDPHFYPTFEGAEQRRDVLAMLINEADRDSVFFLNEAKCDVYLQYTKKGSAAFSIHEVKDGCFISRQARIVKAWAPNRATMCF